MRDRSVTDELAVGGRDGLAQLGKRHPVDAHRLTTLFRGEIRNTLVELSAAVPCALAVDADGALPISDMTSVDADRRPRTVVALREQADEEAGLKDTMPLQVRVFDTKAEHRSAKHERVDQRGADDVLNNVGNAGSLQPIASSRDKILVLLRIVHRLHGRVSLAGRACPDEVEAIKREGQRVRLMKLEWIPRLGPNIDADNFEASLMQTHRSAASTAKQIKGSELLAHGYDTACGWVVEGRARSMLSSSTDSARS